MVAHRPRTADAFVLPFPGEVGQVRLVPPNIGWETLADTRRLSD